MTSLTLDVAAFAIRDGALAVLVRRAGGRWELPRSAHEAGPLDQAAARLARTSTGRVGWLSLAGAFDDCDAHPSKAPLSLAFAALVPRDAADDLPDDHQWRPLEEIASLPARQRRIADAGLGLVRDRADRAPVAFRLLPAEFTLAELQRAYELLLGHPVHKASFRRSLGAAALVEPTGDWRTEGRGRPAQLYRLAKRKRRPAPRSVRFDL